MTRQWFNQTNSLAARNGLAMQGDIVSMLRKWRSEPMGAKIAKAIFGMDVCLGASSIVAAEYPTTGTKPDLWCEARDGSSVIARAEVSSKLITSEMAKNMARPSHHAGRVPFRCGQEHGILPADDHEVEGLLLSHFIDGESIGLASDEKRERVLSWLNSSRRRICESAIIGVATPFCTHLVISLSNPGGDVDVRIMPAGKAVDACSSPLFSASEPRDGQVGTIGNEMIHLQRGQALSAGEQRDIQIKINAMALFSIAGGDMGGRHDV